MYFWALWLSIDISRRGVEAVVLSLSPTSSADSAASSGISSCSDFPTRNRVVKMLDNLNIHRIYANITVSSLSCDRLSFTVEVVSNVRDILLMTTHSGEMGKRCRTSHIRQIVHITRSFFVFVFKIINETSYMSKQTKLN